jgi:hypothetical protein
MNTVTEERVGAEAWSEWADPAFLTTNLSHLRAVPTGGELLIVDDNEDERVGVATFNALQELSHKIGFDTDFVLNRLPLDLAAQVINHRITSANDREVSLVTQGDRFTSFLPTPRELLTYRETADVAFDTMSRAYGNVSVDLASNTHNGMRVRLLTDLTQPITRAVGDVLQMGVEVTQEYGDTTAVQLHLRRLICLNGMTAMRSAFSWRSKNEGTRDHQRLWLARGIAEALGAYDEIVERSRFMAETTFDGDPRSALRERARAMRFPMRHIDAVYRAFDDEPGTSEWALANAFTRIATHGALPGDLGQRVQGVIGDWTQGFNLVTARMPRPVAERVGAQIIEAIDAAGGADD